MSEKPRDIETLDTLKAFWILSWVLYVPAKLMALYYDGYDYTSMRARWDDISSFIGIIAIALTVAMLVRAFHNKADKEKPNNEAATKGDEPAWLVRTWKEGRLMDWNNITRHPLFLIGAAAAIAIAFYYFASPYQNCLRTSTYDGAEPWCARNTNW